MTLGEKLAKLRRERNYTQEQLAEILGVSRQAISKWESNSAYPETEKLIRLTKMYDCSLDYLLLDKKTEQPKQAGTLQLDLSAICIEKVSERKIGNLPLWHINIGYGRVAKGVFALGLVSKGVVSFGLVSVGIVSCGVLGAGLVALGSMAAGIVSLGAIAAGIIAIGAVAMGVFAFGASAIGLFAVGAAALGNYAALGDSARAAVASGWSEANGSFFEVLVTSWNTWYRHGDTVAQLLEETVPWYLGWCRKLFLWLCERML